PAQPVAAPARPAGQPPRHKPQDRAGIPHPPRLPGALRPAHQERRGLPQEMVLVGHPQPPAADDRRGTHGQTPLERESAYRSAMLVFCSATRKPTFSSVFKRATIAKISSTSCGASPSDI